MRRLSLQRNSRRFDDDHAGFDGDLTGERGLSRASRERVGASGNVHLAGHVRLLIDPQ
jgi:hypothetical protein